MAHMRPATAEHEALALDIKRALAKHPDVSGMEMLGVLSVILGQLIALQDQTRYTREGVMEMVARNIEEGNHSVIRLLHQTEGSA